MGGKKSIIDESRTAALVEKLGKNVSAALFQSLEREVDQFQKTAGDLEKLIPTLNNSASESMEAFRGYNDRLGELISDTFQTPDDTPLKDIYKRYTREIEELIADLPVSVTLVQDEERFRPLPGDSYRIRYRKGIKRMIRTFQVTGLPIVNFFRRIVGREVLKTPVWRHQVAVRQIYRQALRNSLLNALLPRFEEALCSVNELHYRLMQLDSRLSGYFFLGGRERVDKDTAVSFEKEYKQELKKIASEAKKLHEGLAEEIKQEGATAIQRYYQLERISGTVEYPDSKSAVRTINRTYARLLLDLGKVVHTTGNAGHFIFDDWRFDTALNGLSLVLMKEKSQVHHMLGEKLRSDLQSFAEAYGKLIEARKAQIEEKGSSPAMMKSVQKEFKPEFASLLIRTLSALKSHKLPGRLKNISNIFSDSTSGLSETRILVRKFDPSRPVRDRDIIRVRPADILRLEVLPAFQSEVNMLASATSEQLESLYNQLTGIGSIAEFSIESAIQQVDEKHEGDKDPVATLVEGLDRSVEKISGVMAFYREMEGKLHKDLSGMIDEQVERLQGLRENEKVFSLNLQLARIRFRKRFRERAKDTRERIGTFIKQAAQLPDQLGGSASGRIGEVLNRVVKSSAAEAISAELSAFLSESKEAFSRLPYIYQRLYLVEPLTDDLFYYPREREQKQLDNAISSWENRHYSPVAIICEKGSGATSFINRYRDGITKYDTVKIGSLRQIYTREDFLGFLAEKMELEGSGLTEVVEELNRGDERIVFLEDLQNQYLRTVDGFDALKTLFTLMSLTNQKVLWVASCTRYAWEYLQLSLHISGFFNTMIHLGQLNDASIRELILKRHAISGYSIRYQPNKQQAKLRQYRKLPAAEKQAYLEEKYFANLNRFAEGNISLALHFWLRSTKEVQERQIIMSSLYESDYGFLNTLSTTQLVVLTMIALHDGINSFHLSQILRRPEEEAAMELNQLYDDSVVVKRDDYFLINPLLYRQLIEFLKRKNFIH